MDHQVFVETKDVVVSSREVALRGQAASEEAVALEPEDKEPRQAVPEDPQKELGSSPSCQCPDLLEHHRFETSR